MRIIAAIAILANVQGCAPKAPVIADAVLTTALAICIFLFISNAFLAAASCLFAASWFVPSTRLQSCLNMQYGR